MDLPAASNQRDLSRRLLAAVVALVAVYAAGTFGYYLLGDGRWSLADCAYMTVISITTVGYAEVLRGFRTVPFARLFTSGLLIAGLGISIYAVSVLTTFLVEGEFLDLRRRRKMRHRIEKAANHIIVCGAGRTGNHIVSELDTGLWTFVVIDTDHAAIEQCRKSLDRDFDYIVGDATDDAVLRDAGVERAHGLIAALPEDKDNLYAVVATRGLNPNLRIVAKAVDPAAVTKLRMAGAHRVVSVNRLGGRRMASEMIRPHAVEFIETMIRDKDKNLRFEEITIPPGSSLAGKILAETDIRKAGGLLVVAAGHRGSKSYTYSPGPDFPLEEGMTLIVLGETKSVQRLRDTQSSPA